MSEQNTLLIEEVGKLLGDSLGGKLAQTIADLLRLERSSGEQAERERIIKVLLTTLEHFDCDVCGECVTPTRLVELIKGENK